MRAINGIEAVELLASADPALAEAARQRGRVPVFERTAGSPSVQNGVEGVIFGTSASGPGSVLRLDSADPALALAARQRGQRVVVVVDSSGAVVPATPASAWYESASYATLSHVADFNNDRYAMPAFGTELIPDPTFASSAGWNNTGNWSISGGVMSHTSASTSVNSVTASAVTAGKLYQTTFTISAITTAGSGISIRVGGTIGTIRSALGTYTEYVTAGTDAASNGVGIIARGASGDFIGSIDNVSIKEIVLTPTGRTYGAELLDNGDFSTGGVADASLGWVLKTPAVGTETMTISGGTLNLTGDGTNQAYADQSFTTVIGQVYEVVFTTTGTVALGFGVSQGSTAIQNTTVAAGTWTYKFVATATTTWARFAKQSAGTSSVDNVSIRALTAIGTYPKQAATFDEFFAFTAASDVARTYIDVNGVMQNNLAVNARRMTYVNAKRQLRLENAGTNICTSSNILDNAAAWAIPGLTLAAGTNGWWEARETAANTFHRIYRAAAIAVAASTQYTWSALVQKVGRRYLGFRGDIVTPSTVVNVGFDLDTLTVPYASAGYVGRITQRGVNTYLLEVTATTNATTTSRNFGLVGSDVSIASDTNPTYLGDTAQGFNVLYQQFEANAFATDHIPTAGASVTRAIETCRFSPAVEAVLQRAQATAVVRAQSLDPLGALIGIDANATLIGTSSARTQILPRTSTGTALGSSVVMTEAELIAAFGAVSAFDVTGHIVAAKATLGASHAATVHTRAAVYLGRPATIAAASGYGSAYYDLVGFSPERLPATDLQTLAVAAA